MVFQETAHPGLFNILHEAGLEYQILAGKSDLLNRMIASNGIPPLWQRKPGFDALVRIVLEQAVSLESGHAVYEKCKQELGEISPASFLAAAESVFLGLGFSRMKLKSCRVSAEQILAGRLNLQPLSLQEDSNLATTLLAIPGIGPWTVDIYFLLVLQRADIWPVTDRALVVAVSQAMDLNNEMNREEIIQIAENWRPYRSWAARIFWHDYLIRRNRVTR